MNFSNETFSPDQLVTFHEVRRILLNFLMGDSVVDIRHLSRVLGGFFYDKDSSGEALCVFTRANIYQCYSDLAVQL